jgi:hypothetical protein
MLLHGGKGDEVIKSFFNEVYGYYVKVGLCDLMNHLLFPVSNMLMFYLARSKFSALDESILQI